MNLAACAAFLACISSAGLDPSYIHGLLIRPPQVEFFYDGTLNETVLDAVRACAKPEIELVCEFHAEEQ